MSIRIHIRLPHTSPDTRILVVIIIIIIFHPMSDPKAVMQ